MKRHDTRDELKDTAPTLAGMRFTNPFATPENYFDALPRSLMNRVQSQPTVIELPQSRWKSFMSVAAVVAALAVMSLPVLRDATNGPASTNAFDTEVAIERVSDDELFTAVELNVTSLSLDDIASHVSDAALDTLEKEWLAVGTHTTYDDALLDAADLDVTLIESL